MEMRVTTVLQEDDYHTAAEVNAAVKAIAAALGVKTVKGSFTLTDVYDSRAKGFIALMEKAHQAGLEVGWSKKHDDGELCFGGGWVISWIVAHSGKQARYHMEDTRNLPPELEREIGSPWNGEEETLDALKELGPILDDGLFEPYIKNNVDQTFFGAIRRLLR